jgi:hypothetical protein
LLPGRENRPSRVDLSHHLRRRAARREERPYSLPFSRTQLGAIEIVVDGDGVCIQRAVFRSNFPFPHEHILRLHLRVRNPVLALSRDSGAVTWEAISCCRHLGLAQWGWGFCDRVSNRFANQRFEVMNWFWRRILRRGCDGAMYISCEEKHHIFRFLEYE